MPMQSRVLTSSVKACLIVFRYLFTLTPPLPQRQSGKHCGEFAANSFHQTGTMQMRLPQTFTLQMRFATTLRQPHLHYLNGCWKFKQTCCGDVLANFWRCSGEHLAIFWRCFFNHMNNRALAYLKVVLTREM